MRAKHLSTDRETKALDFARSTQYFTLDAITLVGYGKAFGYILSERDAFDYISLSTGATPFLKLCGEVPFLQKIFFSVFMLGLVGPKDRGQKGLGKFLGYVVSRQSLRVGAQS